MPAMGAILAIESSCDETAAAVVVDGHAVLAERVASQAEAFAEWGGVVPELAARGHVGWLPGLVSEVLAEAGMGPGDLAAVAVGAWPGLIGSLLCGMTCAKVLARRWDLPLVAVDHVQAHLAAVHLGRERVSYPLVGLVASGGHSHVYASTGPGALELLGGTIDDAAGEAFDKAASMLELGYPGGPVIDRLAADGDPKRFRLPRSFRSDESIRFSFAGLKTSLLYRVRGPKGRDPLALDSQGVRDACASFQAAVVDSLAGKLVLAASQRSAPTIAVGGGVACNRALRRRLEDEARQRGWELLLPAPRHCIDNAAMIAALAHFKLARGETAPADLVPLPTGAAGPRSRG